MIGFNDFGKEFDDTGRGIELAAFLSFRAGELAQEVFIDSSEGVVICGGRNFGDLLEQFLEQGAGEKIVGLGRTPASCGFCFSISRIAVLTFAPMFSASGRFSR